MTEIIDFTPHAQSAALEAVIGQLDNQIRTLAGLDDADSALKSARIVAERTRLIRQLKAVRKAEAREVQASADPDLDDDDLIEIVNTEIREWLADNDYRYVHADDTFWLHRPDTRSWSPTTRAALQNHNPRLKGDYLDAFIRVLHADGRWFDRQTVSFASPPPRTLNRLTWSFVEPVADQAPHWMIDTLIASIAGGRSENIEHLERLILAKWRRPSNYLLPSVVVSDDGGTGKGLFAERLLPTIFDGLVKPNVSMAELTGQFTAHLAGQAVLFINEAVADKTDDDALKRYLGSKTVKSERKGRDATQVDQTALVFIVGNSKIGTVKLNGAGVDRRYSVMKNHRPLKSWIADHMGVSEEAAVEWLHREGQYLVSDPVEVGRWIQSLIDRHGEVDFVAELHGEDYRSMLSTQKDLAIQVIEAFLASPALEDEGSYVNRALLFDAYLAVARHDGLKNQWSRQRFISTADDLIREAGFEARKVKWLTGSGASTTANVIYRGSDCPARLKQNDGLFIDGEGYGLDAWLISLDR